MSQDHSSNQFYRLTIQPVLQGMENLVLILRKAEAHAAEKKIAPDALLNARLHPDMFSLIQQLQYVLYLPTDFAQHFADTASPHVGYDEASFADVYASLKIATDYLKAIPPQRFAERASRIVPIFLDSSRGMTALDCAASIVMPDFYFHLTIAYAILRHNGVALGKQDFIGSYQSVELVEQSR